MKQHRNATIWFDRGFFINLSGKSEELDGTVAMNPSVNSLPSSLLFCVLDWGPVLPGPGPADKNAVKSPCV